VKVALRVLAGAALLVLAIWYVDPAALMRSLAGVELWLFGVAVVVAVGRNLAAALRWSSMARALGLNAPVKPALILSARSITASIMLPGAMLSGDVLRAYQLSQLGNPLAASAWSVFLDRISGLWVLFGMSAVAALWLGYWTYAALLAAAFAAIFVPLPVRGRLGELHRARPVLLASSGYSFVVQLLAAGVFWLCALSVGASVSYAVMLAASAPVFVMASLPIGVGGFGAREAASVAVLAVVGVPADQALAAGLLYGLAGVVLGILAAPLFFTKA
jgi:uncharacterized membrane protein YbhN (UPF0104 family)